jgi:hypothetical protein
MIQFMRSKTVKLLKQKLRTNLRDYYAVQWSDELLDWIIFEAQREYALYSGSLRGEYICQVGDDSLCKLPEDFFQVIRIIDMQGRVIPVESYRVLADKHGKFIDRKGDTLQSVCLDFDSLKSLRTYPVLPAGSTVGKLYYKRLPKKGVFEVNNLEAIEQHALYQMYQFIGKNQSQVAFGNFLSLVHKEQQLEIASGNSNMRRTGVYY